MKFTRCSVPDVILIEPQVFEDSRGYFFESFSERKFGEFLGSQISFVQDNESMSSKGVLRGLHFQAPPFSQDKLVRVIQGAVLDVAVDIRKNSPTYGKSVTMLLTAQNKRQLFVPKGFLHGFATLEDNTIFSYKCTDYYAPQSEGTVAWNDQDLMVNWGIENPTISEKDKNGVAFKDFSTPFI